MKRKIKDRLIKVRLSELQTGPVIQTHCVACGDELSVKVYSRPGVLCHSCKAQTGFRKRLIITGITQMNEGHICVSGIDAETLRFVRPVYFDGLERNFTLDGGSQIVKHFNVVEMEFKRYKEQPDKHHPYHNEDWLVDERFAPRLIGTIKPEALQRILARIAVNDLEAALAKQDHSLFVVRVREILDIYHSYYEGRFVVRMDFIDNAGNVYRKIRVKDLLLLAKIKYFVEAAKHRTIGAELVKTFNAHAVRYVRIGLTRKWNDAYWKQVTGLITIPDMFNGESFTDYEKKTGVLL